MEKTSHIVELQNQNPSNARLLSNDRLAIVAMEDNVDQIYK